MSRGNVSRAVASALIFATFVIITTATYSYVPRERNYRYTSNSRLYPREADDGWQLNNFHSVGGQSINNEQSRFTGPSSSSAGEYPQTYRGIVKNRRRNYGEGTGTAQGRYYSSNPEVSTGAGSRGNSRWYSGLKRQSPAAGLKLDSHNRVQMGVSNSLCDDAKTNLTVDWNLSPINYTCYHSDTRYPRSFDAEPLLECQSLPPWYVPGHVCMDQTIPYQDSIPTHGDHRPLWPKFGEYMFVPRERWLHNIEHGAIVMLYHPCAYPSEVNRLRKIVRGCVGKHIITPSTLLSPERPLALVAWGCRLQMAAVDDRAAMNFIQTRAHRGPEGTYTKEGQYDLRLLASGKSSGNGAKYGYSRVSCDTLDLSRL